MRIGTTVLVQKGKGKSDLKLLMEISLGDLRDENITVEGHHLLKETRQQNGRRSCRVH